MMKSKFVLCISLLSAFLVTTLKLDAQFLEPVKWSFSFDKIDEDTYHLVSNAKIDAGWHLYSQTIDEGGPIPTSFTFEEHDNVEYIGSVEESGNAEEKFDPMFEMDVKWFSNEAKFTQVVDVRQFPCKINGELEFMVCDDTRCLPPEVVEFSF